MDTDSYKKEIQSYIRSSMTLSIAFIGIQNGLFDAIYREKTISMKDLADLSKTDPDYLKRWVDAAYSFHLIDASAEGISLTKRGELFRNERDDSMMGLAVQSVLGSHMADRISDLMKTGERPGESILTERPSIASVFGIMLEKSFSSFFENTILPSFDFLKSINDSKGCILDLGCGNGWYLRKILKHFPSITGEGIDGFSENIRDADKLSEKENYSKRLQFHEGDLFQFNADKKYHAIGMNRALHHVWDRRNAVFQKISDLLMPGGIAVIWEPRWPDDFRDLRDISRQGMAFQNLSEHAQGNYFLTPSMIEKEFQKVNMDTEIRLFQNGNEAVILGKKA